MGKTEEFRCFFCHQPADRIAFYSKFYPMDNCDTIEDPVLCCSECYLSKPMTRRLMKVRGGGEGISCILFKTIGVMSSARIGYYLSAKFFPLNHFNSKFWKKLIWRIHFTHLQPLNTSDVAPPESLNDEIERLMQIKKEDFMADK